MATEEEVLEYSAAFIQLYRVNARYLERTAPWVDRVGLAFIKDTLSDEKQRKQLAADFEFSQNNTQRDPWKPRAEGEASHEFTPLNLASPASQVEEKEAAHV